MVLAPGDVASNLDRLIDRAIALTASDPLWPCTEADHAKRATGLLEAWAEADPEAARLIGKAINPAPATALFLVDLVRKRLT